MKLINGKDYSMAIDCDYATKTVTIHHCNKTNCQYKVITAEEAKVLSDGIITI